jgi:rhodanese-related sulfurtransferase
MFFLVFFVFSAVHALGIEEEDDIAKITKEEVQKIIGQPDVTLIDVRYEKNWKKSDMKIAGAIREHPNEIGSWEGKYTKDHKLILYCD